MPLDSEPPDFAIKSRPGWPVDLRVLLDRYPREVWQDHVNLGRLARFWLQIHDGFRTYAATLKESRRRFPRGTGDAGSIPCGLRAAA